MRYLGPKEFGAYNFALAFSSIIAVLSDLGINAILTRDVAKNKDMAQKLLANALGMRLLGSAIVVVLTLVCYPFLGKNQTHFTLILIAVVYTLAAMMQGAILAALVAFEKMEYVFITKMAYYLGVLAVTLGIVAMNLGAANMLSGYTIVIILSIVWGIYWLDKLGVKTTVAFDLPEWQILWLELWPMFGFMAAGAVYANLDTMLISKFFGNEQVGIYQAGYKILYAFQSVNIINSVTFPRFSVLIHEDKKEKLRELLKWLVLGSGVVLVAIAGVITWQRNLIVHLIYGRAYDSAATILSILIWGGVLNYFRIMATNLLVAERKQKMVFRVMIIGLVVNALLNVLVMPRVGFGFAAISLVISEAVILVVATVMAVK